MDFMARRLLSTASLIILSACAPAPRTEAPAAPPEAFRTGAGWLPSGRGVFTERITLGADGKSYTSVIRYEAFDPKGAVMEGGGEATGRGVRMEL